MIPRKAQSKAHGIPRKAQSKAHGIKKVRKILENFCLKMGILVSLGLNFEICVNHTIFESSWEKKNEKKVKRNSPKMDSLGIYGLNFVYSRNINLSGEISKLLILPAPEFNDSIFSEFSFRFPWKNAIRFGIGGRYLCLI